MGRIIGEASGAAQSRGRPWGHNATRLAILEAARRIVACEGMQGVSLSRAADEAGFARATVYGHFRNKEELFVSIVADDLAMLGRMMRKAVLSEAPVVPAVVPASLPAEELVDAEKALGHSTGDLFVAEAPEPVAEEIAPHIAEPVAEEPQPVAVEPEPLAHEPEEQEHEPEPEPQPQEIKAPIVEAPVVQEVSDTEPFEQPQPDPRVSVRRGNLREILQAQTPAEPARATANEDTAQRPGQPRADAWLERRLRVFERGLAEIEARLEKAERGSERAQGIVAEGMRDIQQHLDAADLRQRQSIEGIARRVETSDQRQRGAVAELRSAIDAALGGEGVQNEKPADGEAIGEEEALQFTPSAPAEERPKSEPSESFLSAARRAANAAAELAEAERSIAGPLMGGVKWPTDNDRRKLYTRYLIAGAGILVLTLLGAGMVLRNGSGEVRVPTPRVAVAHPAIIAATSQSSAPLDRVATLANSGDAQAELIVGLKYLQGNGTNANDGSAAHWIALAAQAHDPVAQYFLGTLYERGLGVNRDAAQAQHWFEAAAGQGNRKAMYRLGVAYAEGRGVTKDFVQSAQWFSKAANAGLVDAQFNLAVLYERGQGVTQSLLDAYKWYAIAAAHGDKESQARVDALASQLGPDDMAAAQRAVQEFAPTDFDREANVAPSVSDVAGPQDQ